MRRGETPGWFRTLREETGEDTEGDTQRSRRGHRAGHGVGQRRPRDSEGSFISPSSAAFREGPDRPARGSTAYLGHDAVGQMYSGAAGRERDGHWSSGPPPQKGPCALRGGAARDHGHSPDSRMQAAGEGRTDAHAEVDQAALSAASCNGNAPAQPSPTWPSHSTPRPAPAKVTHPPGPRPQRRHTVSPALSPGPATSLAFPCTFRPTLCPDKATPLPWLGS